MGGRGSRHRQSDGTSHNGKLGGGGTDSHLRYLLIESMQWVCQIPRYREAYERAVTQHPENMPPRLPMPCSDLSWLVQAVSR